MRVGKADQHGKLLGQLARPDRLFAGLGTLTYTDGKKYVGSFSGDLPEGFGTLISPDGSVYEGSFKNGRRNGKGKITYPNGNIVEGQFRDDQLQQ